MTRPRWLRDAAEQRRQEIAAMRRRGFGLPAARDLADKIDSIEADRRAREAAPDRVTAGDWGVCALIAGLIVIGLPVCAVLFAMGGG